MDCTMTPPQEQEVSSQKKPLKREYTIPAALQCQIEAIGKPEERIRFCLDQMRAALFEARAPRFKDFWDLKRACLDLFKKVSSSPLRAQMWDEYTELSKEARHVKEILDEESAFAVEQIELALVAIEKDLENYTEILEHMPALFLLEESLFLQPKKEEYQAAQKELSLLSQLATRLTALRKEVLKTEMRIRLKNGLLDRLSKAGDTVFPKRKEKIRSFSSQVVQDMEQFEKESADKDLFVVQQEVKLLQSLMKELMLDSPSFGQVRLLLSRVWDLLKVKKQQERQDSEEKKLLSRQNFALVMDRIKPLAEKCQKEATTLEEASKHGGEILTFMRSLDLSREETGALKDEIQKAKAPLYERQDKEHKEKERVLQEENHKRKLKLDTVLHAIEEVISKVDELSVQEASDKRTSFLRQVMTLGLNSVEKEVFEGVLKRLRDKIIEKKEKRLQNLPPSALQSLEELTGVLEERKEQRAEIKTQLESYKKALASSGLDFQKAMQLKELVENEKERLQKVLEAISSIEEKIAEIE